MLTWSASHEELNFPNLFSTKFNYNFSVHLTLLYLNPSTKLLKLSDTSLSLCAYTCLYAFTYIYIYTHVRRLAELAALQVSDVTDSDFGGARLEFRSVWSRLISPSVMAHNAVPIALRPGCIGQFDWSGMHTSARAYKCIHTTANCRMETWGGSIRGVAIDFGVTSFVPISSNPQQLASLHKNNTATSRAERTRDFSISTVDVVGQFLFFERANEWANFSSQKKLTAPCSLVILRYRAQIFIL